MLADVYRSRRGLLAGPPVPSIAVRADSGHGGGVDLLARVATLLDPVLDGAPVPVVLDAAGLTVLLAMVDPGDVYRAHTALRSGLDDVEVTRRALGIDDLVALGSLGGRLTSVTAHDPLA
jgi:hypothetical protein